MIFLPLSTVHITNVYIPQFNVDRGIAQYDISAVAMKEHWHKVVQNYKRIKSCQSMVEWITTVLVTEPINKCWNLHMANTKVNIYFKTICFS